MNFDYNTIYNEYSNDDLLEILKNKQHYQHTAVAAAEDILAKRGISKEQLEIRLNPFAENQADELEFNSAGKSHSGQMTDLLNDEELLGHSAEEKKWHRYLLVVLAIDIFRQLYGSLSIVIEYFEYVQSDSGFVIIQLIYYVFNATVFYLIYKKAKAGWYILMCLSAYSAIVRIYFLFRWLFTDGSFNSGIFQLMITLITSMAALFILWKPPILKLFNTTKHLRSNLFAFSCLLALLYVIYHFNSAG